MSIRVMEDGKTADRTDCRKVRKQHKPVPRGGTKWTCDVCGEAWFWATHPGGRQVMRHYPGTFWVDDTDRTRW